MIEKDFVVSPFTVVVDSREQAPWSFLNLHGDAKHKNAPLLVRTISAGLQTGDYSIEGLERQVCIERKSHEDLVGSVSFGRARFQAEIERMKTMRYSAIVVEASIAEILHKPLRHSRMNPKAVIRTAMSWSIRFGVHWWFAPSRAHAETMCYRLLEQFWRIIQEGD